MCAHVFGVHLGDRRAARRGPCGTPPTCRSTLRAGGRGLRRPLDARSGRRRRRSRGRGRRSSRRATPRTSTSPPSNGSLRPSERGDAYARSSLDRERRAPRGSATSRCRPCPVAPIEPDPHDLLTQSSVELERRVQRPHRALDVVLGDHARDPDRRRADHLDVDALGRERLEHLGGDAGMRLHARADERDAADVLVGAEAARLGVDDDLLHARRGARRRRRAAP